MDINNIEIVLTGIKEESASNDIIHILLSPSELSCIIYALDSKQTKSGCKSCGGTTLSNEKLFADLNMILNKWREKRYA